MTLEEYQQKMTELGIERYSFESDARFPADPQSVVACYRAGTEAAINYKLTSRITPPFEDFSHMNPPKKGHPWLTPERKKEWIAKRKATIARKAGGK
jgi:hypothetical protein